MPKSWKPTCLPARGARASIVLPTFVVSTLLVSGLWLSACGKEAEPLYDCSRNPPLSYENFGQGFLERNCTGCHSSYLTSPEERNYAPLDVNLNTYADAVHWRERIFERTVTDQTMPPAGGLVATDLNMLGEWLNCDVLADEEAQQEGSP